MNDPHSPTCLRARENRRNRLSAAVLALALVAADTDAPPLVQAQEHMYNAVGRKVSAAWVVETTTVGVGESFSAVLVVRGAENPGRIRKPNLGTLPAFANAFVIEAAADPPAAAGEARFAYTLRPRAVSVAAVPELQFRFYVPTATPGSEVQTTYAKKVTIAVREAVVPPVADLPLPPPPDKPGPFAWAGLVVGLVVGLVFGTTGYVVWWRHRNPSGPERERRQRERATRMLRDRLSTATTTDDVAAAVREFAAVRPEAAELLATCDTARYAPAGTDPRPLIDAARRLAE